MARPIKAIPTLTGEASIFLKKQMPLSVVIKKEKKLAH